MRRPGSPPASANAITELTRLNLFDELKLEKVEWAGRLAEDEFLSRIFDLEALPSTDHRHTTMAADVGRHRVWWGKCDWTDDWVYDDKRLNLMRGPDDLLLNFLCQMVHPMVRSDEEEVRRLVDLFNRHLLRDGFEIVQGSQISGRPIYIGRPRLEELGAPTGPARSVADEFGSLTIASQITRMETSVRDDPALAIGSAKEFVESVCKGILRRLGYELTGKEDLPKLVHLTRMKLQLDVGRETEDTLKRTLSSLATITQGVAELRGQLGTGHGPDPAANVPPRTVARLAVGSAVVLGVFLYETYRDQTQGGTHSD